MLKRFSLIVIAGGLLAMLIYFIRAVMTDSDVPPNGFRIGIAMVMAGSVLLLISVGWERYREWKGEDDDFRGTKY